MALGRGDSQHLTAQIHSVHALGHRVRENGILLPDVPVLDRLVPRAGDENIRLILHRAPNALLDGRRVLRERLLLSRLHIHQTTAQRLSIRRATGCKQLRVLTEGTAQ